MRDRLYLLDTNVLLALIRGQDLGQSIDRTFNLSTSPSRPLVSIVSYGEIRVLARRNNWGREKTESLENMLHNVVPVYLSLLGVINAYVEIDLASQSHPSGAINMEKNDLWIAACAKAAGAFLLTTDKDFEHLLDNTVQGTVIDPMTHLSGPQT